MSQKKIHNRHPSASKGFILLLLIVLQLHTIAMLTIVNSSSSSSESEDAKSESLSISSSSSDGGRSSSSEEESFSKEVAAPLLTFSLRPGNNKGSLEQSNLDNNAGIHKAKIEAGDDQKRDEFHFYSNEDNDGDNNDSNVSSESDTGKGLGRFRREEVREAGGPSPPEEEPSKAISTNWGTYEEQVPVVVHSGSSSIDESDATGVGRTATDADEDDDSYAYGDEYQSKEDENYSSEYDGEGAISYDYDYEGGRFEGRQFYSNQANGDVVRNEDADETNGYYRQQYYATARPLRQQQISVQGNGPHKLTGVRRPGYRNRFGQYRPNKHPQFQQPNEDDGEHEEEEESTGSSLMGFFQKAKTFYDIFQAMNSAWKTVEDHYRKTGKGVFPEDLKHLNQSTQTAPNTANQSVNNNTRKMNTKRLRTTRVPITSTTEDDRQQQQQQEEQQQQDRWQEKDEYRSRRSWLKETGNDNKESPYHIVPSREDDSQITESGLATDSSASGSSSSSSTAIAEGRYIKGDPLKGYYDFVITEGSYKFWAVFQVGTALLIIYSTFAAIYYSKVNPLVSDYDYVDYLGGGRSLSDDSDFVDMDAPMSVGAGAAADGSETTPPEGVSRSRQQQQQQSSAGWIGWLPHAGHTLRFILESIDKVYNEE